VHFIFAPFPSFFSKKLLTNPFRGFIIFGVEGNGVFELAAQRRFFFFQGCVSDAFADRPDIRTVPENSSNLNILLIGEGKGVFHVSHEGASLFSGTEIKNENRI
jgi:hypothetical protein